MFYKCNFYGYGHDGKKFCANVPLRFEDTSLEEVFQLSRCHCRGRWEFADVWGFDGSRWRFVGVFWLGEEVTNG